MQFAREHSDQIKITKQGESTVSWRRDASKKEYKKAKKNNQKVSREEDSDGDSEYYIYFDSDES